MARVLLVCDSLHLAGGVERFVCALANHLVGEGFEVAVASVDTPREALRYPIDAAVRVLQGAPRRALSEEGHASGNTKKGDVQGRSHAPGRAARSWHLLRAQWHAGRTLGAIVRAEAPDVVLLNGVVTACSVLALDRSWAMRAICCDHNHFFARSSAWQHLRAWLYPKVAAVVSLTEADAVRFRALNDRTVVIRNASTLRAEQPALLSAPRVLAVGRHVEQKGFDLLLRAWAIVIEARPDARLRIVGDGPLAPTLAAMAVRLGIAHAVEWLAPTPAIEAQFRAAAVFALPSRYEGAPLALLEAQALGVPAVAFDCPTGPREILGEADAETDRGSNQSGGLLIRPNDVAGFAAALLRLLGDADLRECMARAAIRRSRSVFDPATHFAQWTALLREVAERPR